MSPKARSESDLLDRKDEEIFIAKRGVATRCAIAAAIMNQIPAARHIKVNQDTISWLDVDRRERLVFRTPPKAAEFIDKWDSGEDVTPLRFSLTDTALIERREPRTVSTRTRVKRVANPVVQKPGARMNRPARGERSPMDLAGELSR